MKNIKMYFLLSLFFGLNGMLYGQQCTINELRNSIEGKWLFGITLDADDIDDVVELLCEQVPIPPSGIDFYTGSWPEIDYQDQSSSGWDPSNHLENLTELSEAYALEVTFNQACGGNNYTQNDLENAIINGLKFWYNYSTNPTCNPAPCPCATACPCSGSWFKNSIGKQIELQRIGVLSWDFLSTNTEDVNGMTLLEHIINDLANNPSDCDDSDIYTGANLANTAGSMLVRGVLLGDETSINEGLDALSLALEFAPEPDNESIQQDYSFHQHGALLYNGGYGLSFLEVAAPWAATIRDCSNYGLNGGEERLVNLVLEGYRRMTIANNTDYCANGRNIVRRYPNNNAAIPDWVMDCLVYMTEGTPEESELSIMRTNMSSGSLQDLTGNKYFWKSDYVSHMEAGSYFSSVRMSSGRTIGTENESDENLLGYWLPFGCTFIYEMGDEYIRYDGSGSQTSAGNYINIFPQWDWAKVPGVTSPNIVPPLDDEGPCPDISTNDANFVGSAGNDNHGVSAMRVQDSYSYGGNDCNSNSGSMSAKKSWFHFGEEIVALGTNITGTDLHTTINQCLMDGGAVTINQTSGSSTIVAGTSETNYTAVNSITHDGIDYIFPNPTDINISTLEGTGDWEDIALGEGDYDDDLRENIFKAWIPHTGTGGQGNSYLYIINPDQQYSNNISELLPDNDHIHVVKKDQLGGDLVGAVFYPSGFPNPMAVDVGDDVNSALTFLPDHQCALFYTESKLEVCISSPGREHNVINLTVNGNVNPIVFNLPDGGGHNDGTSECISFSDFNICGATSPLEVISVLDIPGAIYNWTSSSPGVFFSNNMAASPTITFPSTGDYEISQTITLNGNSVSTTKEITIVSTEEPLEITSTEIDPCNYVWNFSINQEDAFSHLWSVNINGVTQTSTDLSPDFMFENSGIHVVNYTATDACGNNRSTTRIVKIIINSIPQPALTSIEDDNCENIFTFSASFPGTYTGNLIAHLWEIEPNSGTNAEDAVSVEESPTHVFTVAGDYTVTYMATDDCGNIGSNELQVTVTNAQSAETPILSSTEAAACPSSFTFTAENNETAVMHFWDFGDGTPLVSTDELTIAHNYIEVGEYTVYYSAMFACEVRVYGTLEVEVEAVAPSPIADFDATPNGPCGIIDFTNTSSDADSYAWDFGDGNTSTQENPNNNYSTSGSYTVELEVSNDCGADVATQSINVTVETLNAGFTATQNCLEYTFVSDDPTAGTHSWDFGDGNTAGDVSTVNHTFAEGSFTVTHTVTSNCGPVSEMVVVNPITCTSICNDCPSGGTEFDGGTGMTASSLGLGNLSNECISISGKVIIDNSYTWNGVTVYLNAGAEIEVDGNLTFTVEDCTFEGCEQMWNGILVQGNSTLLMDNSTVRDAQYAVTKSGKSQISLTLNSFEDNFIGLRVLSPLSTQTTTINGNTFQGSNNGLLAPFQGQTPSPGTIAKAAIFAYHTNLIYDGSFASNEFINIENGFIAEYSLVSIKGTTFIDLINGNEEYVYQPNNLDWLTSVSGHAILTVNSWGNISGNSISNIHTGILVDHGRVKLEGNAIDNIHTGIHARTVWNFGNEIKDNTISNFRTFGIRGFIKGKGILSIYFNDLTSASSVLAANEDRVAIAISSAIVDSKINGQVMDNTINMESLGSGISILNVGGLPVQRNEISYSYSLQNNPNELFGSIKVENSHQNNITRNEMELASITPAGTDERLVGLEVEASHSGNYCCNEITGTAYGMTFRGMANSSKIWSNELTGHDNLGLYCPAGTQIGVQPHRGNTWDFTVNGARHDGTVFEIAESVFQIESNPPLASMWPGNPVPSSGWFVPENGNSSTSCPSLLVCPKYYIAEQWPPKGGGGTVGLQEPGNEGILYTRGQFNQGAFGATLNWEGQRNLYAQLLTEPAFSNYHPSIDSFYQANAYSNIQKLYEVDESIKDLHALTETEEEDMAVWQEELDEMLGQIEALYAEYAKPNADHTALNNSMNYLQGRVTDNLNDLMAQQENLQETKINNIPATEVLNTTLGVGTVYEANEKAVNTIYLNTVAKDIFTFSSAEKNALAAIAFQCPFTDGYAVYRARAMYRLVEPGISFNDDLLCAVAQGREPKEQAVEILKEPVFSISPNPANEELNLQITPQVVNLKLDLRSITGELLKSLTIASRQTDLSMNTADLPAGIYYISVSDTERILETQRVIIIH